VDEVRVHVGDVVWVRATVGQTYEKFVVVTIVAPAPGRLQTVYVNADDLSIDGDTYFPKEKSNG